MSSTCRQVKGRDIIFRLPTMPCHYLAIYVIRILLLLILFIIIIIIIISIFIINLVIIINVGPRIDRWG